MAPRGDHARDASSCSKTEPCVGMSGSVFNRVRESNRVVGGTVHHCASPRAAERIGNWVFGGRAADTDRRSFGANRPHASRSQQHTGYEEPSRTRRGCKTQEAEIATGRVKRAVRPRGDPISMGVLRPQSAGKERSRQEKTKSTQAGLTIAAT
jgi:hypothetical protein